jgi:hypothetical protein
MYIGDHKNVAHHVVVTNMEELDHGSHHPLIKHPETDMSRPEIEPQLPVLLA